MTFGEKLREVRLNRRMTQEALATQAGIAKRTLINYEVKGLLPKSRDTYYRLAEALDVDPKVLINDDEDFVVAAAEKYGNRGMQQAMSLLQQVNALYAGGELADDDMDAMNKALQEAYMIAKERNKRFTNKRYLHDEAK